MKRELNRFSFRKTKAFGLCSAALAVFILANGANSAFADDGQSDNSDNLTLVDSSTADSSDTSDTAESTTLSVPESAISYDENDAYVPSEVEEAIVQAVTEVKAAGGEVEVVEDEPVKLAYDEYYDTEEKVASIKEDTKTYLDALSTYQKEQESYQEEKANYDETVAQLTADYQDALTKYHNKLAKYQEDLASYNEAKSAYEAYVAEVKAGGQAAVETVQKLTFTTEPNAIVTVAGISQYLTKEAVERLGQSGMWAQYTSGNVSASDLTTSSPYQNDEDQWAYIKEGGSYTVTYTNLTNSAYEDSAIKKVVYHYHLNSSTASDGQAIVRIHRDPTTGLITYTPEVKYDGSHHIERVGIGNNQFIKIPGSSITLQDSEAYAVNDNQYIAHGATFNGESSGQASDGTEVTGWDSQSSPYYYYGGAGVLLDDAH